MSIETEPTAGELLANEASASARKKTVAAKPKGAPASKTRKAAGRPPQSSRARFPYVRPHAIGGVPIRGRRVQAQDFRSSFGYKECRIRFPSGRVRAMCAEDGKLDPAPLQFHGKRSYDWDLLRKLSPGLSRVCDRQLDRHPYAVRFEFHPIHQRGNRRGLFGFRLKAVTPASRGVEYAVDLAGVNVSKIT
jgi:hypothetical protein